MQILRVLKTVLLVQILDLFFVSPVQAQTAREVAQQTFPSVVVLIAEKAKGKRVSLGSGFFVRHDVIATNYHVIKGASRLYIKFIGRKSVYLIKKVLAVDASRDIALLKLASVTNPPLLLGDSRLVGVGDVIYVVGNPQGLEGTFSQGVVSGIRLSNGRRYLQITAPISPGSSGGPVLNTTGEVIGIAVGTLKEGQNLNFAIPVSDLKSLLARALPDDDTSAFDGDVKEFLKTTPDQTYKPRTSPFMENEIKTREGEVRANPRSIEAHFKLAETYRKWHRKLESIQTYKRVIALKPDHAEAHFGLAEAYMMDLFSRLVDDHNSQVEAMKAIEAYKQAIRIKPDYTKAHIGLGEAYSSLQRYAEAKEAFGIAIRLHPAAEEAYWGLGSVLEREEHYLEAIEAYKEVVRVNPRDCLTCDRIAEVYIRIGHYDDAVVYANRAIRSPVSGSVGAGWRTLWDAYRLSGRTSEGIISFNEFISLLRKELDSVGVRGFEKVELRRKLAWTHLSLGILKRNTLG